MAISWNGWYWHLWLASFIAMGGAIAALSDCAHAQVTPDVTLGAESSVVTPTNVNGVPGEQIDGGATRGTNLFHSFDEFSVPNGGEASFNNAADIQNIIGRVTGGSISNIEGLLRANYPANLFLLNPNGIIFGPNATLDIGGSFLGSTASSLNFADGTSFSATAPTTTPLLTVSVPLGLQFGPQAGEIRMQGPGSVRDPETFLLLNREAGLSVPPSETLTLVGSGVALSGGILTTEGGRIELGSVAGPGLVNLTPIDSGWALGYEGVPTFGDIQLSGGAAVDTSGAGGGDIQVQGRQVTLTNGSQIQASTQGAEPGGTLSIASERLTVRDGSYVSVTNFFGTGAGGTLSVTASDIELVGETANGQVSSGLYAQTSGDGNAGDLTIATGRLTVRDGAQVSSSTSSTGAGGTLSVTASDIELVGETADGQFGSGLSAQAYGDGNAGDLTIATGRLTVRDGAQVSSGTFSTGAGGTLSVTASDVVELVGTSANGRFGSGLYALTSGDGNAGDLTVATGRLTVRDGAQVSSSTFGLNDGGNLKVNASDSVQLTGTSANGDFPSLLSTSTEETGKSGDLTINTATLQVQDGAQVSVSTRGEGAAGTADINASESVEVSGRGSGLFNRSGNTGDAGILKITSEELTVQKGAQVSVDNFVPIGFEFVNEGEVFRVLSRRDRLGNTANLPIDLQLYNESEGSIVVRPIIDPKAGSGSTGKLEITADSIRLEDLGRITANSAGGNGGNIELRAENLVLLGNSNISTTAGTLEAPGNGGSITIDTDNLVALENSDIFANAFRGQGGQVIIDASGIFGTEYREDETSRSDITASSNLGREFSGTVEINNPDVDPSQGLVELPAELVDVSNSIAQGCPDAVWRGESKFIITGRGGLPPSPTEPLRGDNTLTNWSTLEEPEVENRSSAAPSTNPTIESAPATIVEANGWVKSDNGEVTLVATAPTANIDIPWLPESSCNAPEPES